MVKNKDVKGSYASINGLNLYYEIHGKGEPLILLHGGVGASEMLEPIMSYLCKKQRSNRRSFTSPRADRRHRAAPQLRVNGGRYRGADSASRSGTNRPLGLFAWRRSGTCEPPSSIQS